MRDEGLHTARAADANLFGAPLSLLIPLISCKSMMVLFWRIGLYTWMQCILTNACSNIMNVKKITLQEPGD
jgi:hypothetical protein